MNTVLIGFLLGSILSILIGLAAVAFFPRVTNQQLGGLYILVMLIGASILLLVDLVRDLQC